MTLFGSAFLVLLLGGTFYFASKPKMSLAYGGLQAAEVGNVVGEIQKMGITVESDIAGNVYVPSNKVAEVRSKIAASGRAPSSGHLGNDDMSKLNAMTTPAVERERLKAILEGELATSIESMDGVSQARVHLTLGERSAFAAEQEPASAAIYLQEQSTGGVTMDQARAIATLVARSVPGLELQKVFVTDSSGRALFDGNSENTSASQANEKLAAEIGEAQRRERDLQGTFDSMFGRGNTMVKVNLSMDFDRVTSRSHSEKRGPKPTVEDTQQEQVKGGSNKSNDSSGAQPNVPGANSRDSQSDGGSYTGTQSSTVYPVSTLDETKEKALGSITKLAVSVMVDKGKADPTAVQSFLDSYLAANPGASATVTEVAFDRTQADEMKKAAGAAASRGQMQQIFSLLPVLALVIVAVLVFKGLAKAAKQTSVLVTALPGGYSGGTALAVTDGGAKPTAPKAVSTGGTAPSESAKPAAKQDFDPFIDDEDEDPIKIAKIRERVNMPLEQIKRMTQERPEAVAMLIKSWLLEERR